MHVWNQSYNMLISTKTVFLDFYSKYDSFCLDGSDLKNRVCKIGDMVIQRAKNGHAKFLGVILDTHLEMKGLFA